MEGGWGGERLFFSLSPSLSISFSLRAHVIFITKDRTDKPVFEDGTEEAKKKKKITSGKYQGKCIVATQGRQDTDTVEIVYFKLGQ